MKQTITMVKRTIPNGYDVLSAGDEYFWAVDETGHRVCGLTSYDEACDACIIDDQSRRSDDI